MAKLKLKKKVKRTLIILVTLGLLLIATSILYCYLASPIDINSNSLIEVKIEDGMSTKEIGDLLKEKELIRSSGFFILYSKLNNCTYLKSSTYDFKKNMSLNTIFETICAGNYSRDAITITFKEGKRITDYAKVISEETNNDYDEIIELMKDREYIKTLIDKYWFLTDDILNSDIYYPLEGYLYPETYKFENKNVSASTIIEVMLNQTDKVLSEYKTDITNGKHTINEYIALASMAELEGTNDENRKMIVGIFENRLKIGMNLGSDVTTYYALQKSMTSDLTASEFNIYNLYNTRNANVKTIPVGPICSVSKSSIEAALYPTASDYYYFVADKNKKVYYTKTSSEHEKKVQELKNSGDWIW